GPGGATTAGHLVAEGDSWFDYPFFDVIQLLEDEHGYDVESVAHMGDAIEEMAYGGSQLADFLRCLEKLERRGVRPKAVLLSGGGNDVAGDVFSMLLNHQRSPLAGLNAKVVEGVIDERIRDAYVTILGAVTESCRAKFGHEVPILLHGYARPVPDGRGFWGGAWFLPGPWLEPGFRQKGFANREDRIRLAGELIDRFNEMIRQVAELPDFDHVHYLDLRPALSNGDDYKDSWGNELHPTRSGFQAVTRIFVEALQGL
ncbi:MAG TPA: SGNH/GDSL hydrolase family protein, partial [Thermoanaerobaculia bacterium]|nr:SGNH/GDSL hydrolase family protein [Thermoanaerobaculia bacterium]